MDFPGSRTPGIMKLVRADRSNGGADVGRAVVIVVPSEVTGNANPPRRMVGRFIAQIRGANERCQRLHANVVAVDGVLRAWRDLANDRGRITRLRRMIGGRRKNFEV